MKRYSNNLRKKVMDYLKEIKNNISKTSKVFNIKRDTIYSWSKLEKEWKLFEIKSKNWWRKSKLDYEAIKKYVLSNPDRYNYEIAEVFNTSTSNIQRILVKLGFTVKKNKQSMKNLVKKEEMNI